MAWIVSTAPASEPVTLAEAKAHCRIRSADTSFDTMLAVWIQAARESVERECERALMPQEWTERRDAFPASCYPASQYTSAELRRLKGIELRGGHVTEIVSFKYDDSDGAEQTLDPGQYAADLESEPALVYPGFGVISWPAVADLPNAVRVRYAVGYADAAAVPASLKAAILLIVGDLYENRQAVTTESGITTAVENPTVCALLFPFKYIRP